MAKMHLYIGASGSQSISSDTSISEIPWIRVPVCVEQSFTHSYHAMFMEYHGLDHNTGVAYRATLDVYGRFWISAFGVGGYRAGDEIGYEEFINRFLPEYEDMVNARISG